MQMTARLAKLVLTAHIAVSVAWLGSVASFLVLSILSLTAQNAEIVRGAYLSMNALGLYAIVPLSFAALLTGLAQSLGTSWGLYRQYWTLVKFGLTLGSVLLLLMHQFGAIERIARLVLTSPAGVLPEVRSTEAELAVKAALAVLVLLVTTTLSVYKPWGLTRYGRRIQQQRSAQLSDAAAGNQLVLSGSGEAVVHRLPLGLKIFLAVTILVVLAVAILGHAGHDLNHHLGTNSHLHHHS
jgi:hypothetical protein